MSAKRHAVHVNTTLHAYMLHKQCHNIAMLVPRCHVQWCVSSANLLWHHLTPTLQQHLAGLYLPVPRRHTVQPNKQPQGA